MPVSVVAALTGLTLAFSPWSVGPSQLRPSAQAHAFATTLATSASEPEADAVEDPEDNGWGDEDTVADDPSDPPVPGDPGTATPITSPTTTDVAGTVPPPVATGIVKQPAPKPDESRKGIGLMIGAGAAGLVAWGAAGARIGMVNRCIESDQDVNTALDCVRQIPPYLGLTILVWLANDATYALAPVAGVFRGRYEAAEYVYSGKYDRKAAIWTGVGGGVLGVGIVGKIALWAMSFNVFKCEANDTGDLDTVDDCIRRRWTGMLIAHQLVSSTIAGGAGALGFGVGYRKERRNREALFFRPEQVRVTPFGNVDGLGLSLTGRF